MSFQPNIPARIAKARAASLFQPGLIIALSTAAPPATAPAQAPPPCSECSLETWIAEKLKSRQSAPIETRPDPRSETPDPELHLPDETRQYHLGRLPICPQCFNISTMHRSYLTGRARYRIECTFKKCAFSTGWQNSSREAVKTWTMLAVLSKE
jgi:hypothetical protein